MAGILLEGVTGAGKTQTLRALSQHPQFSALLGTGRIFDEDETFGEVMSEIQDKEVSRIHHLRRLENILRTLERADANFGFVLERFHPSYYVLLPYWNLYGEIDERLSQLGCRMVLLQFPENHLEARSLDRVDRVETPWLTDMLAHFGSRTAALDALSQSTHRRAEAARRSRLALCELDTTDREWDGYAEEIVKFWCKR